MTTQDSKSSVNIISINGLTWAKTLMICSILLCSGVAAYFGVNVSVNVNLADRVNAIERTLEVPINSSFYPFQNPCTYIIGQLDAYATLQNCTNGRLDSYSTNDTYVIQEGLDNCSIGGGSVDIKDGNYNATPLIRNNTRLIVEKGATGITYGVDSLATCIIDDFNLGLFAYYQTGIPYSILNYSASSLLLSNANLTSLYCTTIDQFTSGHGIKILHLILENGTSFPTSPINQQIFYRTDTGLLYVYNNSQWQPIGYTPNTYPYANLTGTPQTFPYANLTGTPVLLFANGSQALTDNWNIGGTFGIYNAAWLNSTAASLTQLYLNGQNLTSPLLNLGQPASYIISTDGTNCYWKNGSSNALIETFTNATRVIRDALGNMTDGQKLYIKNGDYLCYENTPGSMGVFPVTANYVTIEGESWATIMDIYNGTTMMQQVSINDVFKTVNVIGVTFYNLCIRYNSSSNLGHGIEFDQCRDMTAYHCLFITLGQGAGLNFDSDTVVGYGNAALYNKFVTDTGISIEIGGMNAQYGTLIAENDIGEFDSNNTSNQHPSYGIQAAGPNSTARIYDMVIANNEMGINATFSSAGIQLNGTRDVVITGNRITGYNYGVQCVSDTYRTLIGDNDFTGCSTGATGLNGANGDRAYNNVGYNYQGFSVTTPAVPASGSDAQNTNPFVIRIYILTIGTTTAYNITDPNGKVMNVTSSLYAGMELDLDPAAKIRFTYSVAPTWYWSGA